MKKDKRKIPKGYYCYSRLVQIRGINPPKFKMIGKCPYWSIRKGKPKQLNGYCKYMEQGDWEFTDWAGLIWDMVKECGIKMKWTADDKKYFAKQIKEKNNGKLEK
jgi:hypothetical protein